MHVRAFERLETWFLTKAPGHKDGRLLPKSPPPGRLSCVELLSGGGWSPAGGLSAQGTGKPIKRPEGKTSERPAEEGEVGGPFHNSISLPHTFGTRTKATPENPRRRPHKVPLVLSSSSRVGRESPERSIVNSVNGGHSPAHRRMRVGGGERAERDEARRDRFRRRRETGQIPNPLSQPIGYILFRWIQCHHPRVEGALKRKFVGHRYCPNWEARFSRLAVDNLDRAVGLCMDSRLTTRSSP